MMRSMTYSTLILTVAVSAALGQPINPKVSINANRYAQTPWYGEPGIRQQLKLTDEQYARLNQVYTKAYNTFNQSAADLGNLTDQQRQERIAQNYSTFYKNLDTSSQDLLSPEQRTRYSQLWMQYRGYDSLLDPTVRQKLNLTDAQVAELRQYNTDYQQKMNDYIQQYGTNRDAAMKGYQVLQPQVGQRINQVLTEQQRGQWGEITGSPYRFQPFYGYGTPPAAPTK